MTTGGEMTQQRRQVGRFPMVQDIPDGATETAAVRALAGIEVFIYYVTKSIVAL
jgi:hypothetical protein